MSSSKKKNSNAMSAMGYFWAARAYVTPTLKHTAFLKSGVLTPDEFVTAGDELVYRCPTWSWQPAGSSKAASYLPVEKQFLMTRNVPCRDRVATLEQQLLPDENAGGEDDDWMISSMPNRNVKNAAAAASTADIEDDFDVLDEDGEVVVAATPTLPPKVEEQQPSNDDDEYADMADFEDDNVAIDNDVAVATSDHLVKVRTYDLSMSYDKYYQTPRIWMSGQHDGHPLSAAETMEDVVSDYAYKTVTMEAHPFLSGPHASIHPCQHGKVMKTIVANLMAGRPDNCAEPEEQQQQQQQQQGPSIEMYLFIFLKFVSCMIPTINYDFTMEVNASTTT